MTLQETLKSNKFGLWLSIITVLIQAAHSAYVFQSLSSFEGWLKLTHSVAMALVISGAILFFTLRGVLRLAIFFAVFEALINIAYYIKYIVMEDQSWWLLLIAIPVAAVLPVTLYFYAENIKDKEDEIYGNKLNKVIDDLILIDKMNTASIENINNNLKELKRTTANSLNDLDISDKELTLKIVKRDEKLQNYRVVIQPDRTEDVILNPDFEP